MAADIQEKIAFNLPHKSERGAGPSLDLWMLITRLAVIVLRPLLPFVTMNAGQWECPVYLRVCVRSGHSTARNRPKG